MNRIYVSHSIRGKFGNEATPKQMKVNCDKAIGFGKRLKLRFPSVEQYDGEVKVDWYVPADHDEIISLAYQKGYITDTQILELDCVILNKCMGLLVYAPDNFISAGMQIEIDYAREHKIPTLILFNPKIHWEGITEFVEGL